MMKILRENEQRTFEQIVSLTQPALKKVMSRFLRNKYDSKKIIETKDYICAEGDIPIALVAHMDTVFEKPVQQLFYDTRKNVMWSPQGLGADDRAGIYAIIRILNAGYRPHVILTTDEESGCLGAGELAKRECPFEELNYVIELDRRGTNDCVFYDCDNKDFVTYVEQFGFTEAYGSFSDICEFCPDWGVAGVNLSIGYVDEHSHQELLYVSPFLATIEKVKKMLDQKEIPYFKYVPSPYAYNWLKYKRGSAASVAGYYGSYDWDIPNTASVYPTEFDSHICHICHKEFWEEEMFPVKMKDGTTDWYCTDCIVDNVTWCETCNEPYEIDATDTILNKCPDCIRIEEYKKGAV